MRQSAIACEHPPAIHVREERWMPAGSRGEDRDGGLPNGVSMDCFHESALGLAEAAIWGQVDLAISTRRCRRELVCRKEKMRWRLKNKDKASKIPSKSSSSSSSSLRVRSLPSRWPWGRWCICCCTARKAAQGVSCGAIRQGVPCSVGERERRTVDENPPGALRDAKKEMSK